MLIERHAGEVPQTREELEALPGVGRKTANVVLNTAFRQLTMAVDTHIFRVSNRTGIAPGKNVVEVEKKLMKFVPKEYLLDSPSLADPSRTLRLPRPQASLRQLPDRRLVRIQAQDVGRLSCYWVYSICRLKKSFLPAARLSI